MDSKKEYWDLPPDAGEIHDLDPGAFEELNRLDDPEDEQRNGKSHRGTFFKRAAAVVVLIFFCYLLNSWLKVTTLPSLGFLGQSWKLSQEQRIQEMQQAVVLIRTPGGQGTGFNIDSSGLVVTNYHVVEGNKKVSIDFQQGMLFSEKDWTGFPEADLALVDLKGKDLPALKLDDQGKVLPGEQVLIIGNPLGFPWVKVEGKILGKTELKGWDDPVILIEAPIHQGSSGSPVINQDGKVVGVIFATLKSSIGADGKNTGLAISVETVQKFLQKNQEQ